MIAIKRLQSIMWILIIALGALAAYLISLRVATERNAVQDVIREIRQTRSQIRYMEADFAASANVHQLAAWNSANMHLQVPVSGQYLSNERALAQLDGLERAAPAGPPPPPVMAAMASATPPPPAAAGQDGDRAGAGGVHAADFSLIRSAAAAEPPVARQADSARAAGNDRRPAPVAAPDPAARRAARLAMLDARLLGADAGTGRETEGGPRPARGN